MSDPTSEVDAPFLAGSSAFSFSSPSLQVLIRGPQEGEFVSPPKIINLLRHYQTILEPEMKTEILAL